ncbi:MAG: hypothetical protein WDM85_06600 [Caulobacteraceae bacterium]
MYRLKDDLSALEVAPFPLVDAPPAFCGGGGGLISTLDDYLKFARMLLGNGEVDGVRLLKPETVTLMRANRLTPAQREIPFMGIPFWGGQGFGLGLSVIDDAEKQAWMGIGTNGSFGWPGGVRHLVARRSAGRHDPDLSDPELHAARARSRRPVGDRPAHGREGRPAAVSEPGLHGDRQRAGLKSRPQN